MCRCQKLVMHGRSKTKNNLYKMQIKLTMLIVGLLSLLGLTYYKFQKPKQERDQVKIAFEIKSKLGEGAFWDDHHQRLYWIDIEGKKVYLYDPETKKNQEFDMPSRVGTVVPKNKEEAVIALEDGIYMLNTKSGDINLLSDVEAEMTYNRFNDGKCDPNGNLWVGSMHLDQSAPKANLYKIAPDGQATKMLDSITISNGIVWTSDKKTMYYIDTPTGHIRAFDFDDKTSTISNERVAVVIPVSLGFGDGMTIDNEDKLWVGLWNGNAVARFDPLTGNLLEKIEVPAHNVTSCSFGGENFDTLYITTSSLDMNEAETKKYPLAGSLFEVKPGVKGVGGNFFAQ